MERAAATIDVSICAESGPGSLRDALASAVDGDTIDLTDLRNCTITLETGALTTSAAVTILGPGEADLAIDGAGSDRVLYGLGAYLSISGVTLANGYAPDSGGCLAASGDVALDHVTVTRCRAGSASAQYAYGGGVAVTGDLAVESSTITENTAEASVRARGGGLISLNALSLVDSVISDNYASAAAVTGGGVEGLSMDLSIFLGNCVLERNAAYGLYQSYGGGVHGKNEARLENTRLSNNIAHAKTSAGGGGAASDLDLTLAYDSVVSNNSAVATVGINGSATYGADGGGLLSRFGSVYVTGDPGFGAGTRHPLITGNAVTSTSGYVGGGGVGTRYIMGNVSISFATISSNSIASNANAFGGGVEAIHNLMLRASTVSGNTVRTDCASARCFVGGGGGYSLESIDASYSTVSDNHVSAYQPGVVFAYGGGLATGLYTLSLVESTVSGNSVSAPDGSVYGAYGGGVSGPLYPDSVTVIRNSTIAFNVAGTQGGGLSLAPNAVSSEVASTIVSNNEAPQGADVDVSPFVGGDVVVAGDHDLIVAHGAGITVPADTLASDPRLLPLAGNGGGTRTHELAECSPAKDAGSNPGTFDFDQRLAPYVRESGAAPDIGALELQAEPDRIFESSFELPLCP
ncbi:MAG TPA: choice-of-anchor Q domain-containing protein [Rhodanobacteraceae bacterium]|nr:choice-of-anchor Q domain-containing protein [Rhodanobacteraceae bacterium]